MSGGQFMVVLIVLIGVIGGIIKSRHKSDRHRLRDSTDTDEARRLNDEVRQLKDRIAVLERVVTDNHGSIGLDREIERLRDR
jgi:predicted  nucleic acid-binding Zn-ribbon protein